MPESTTQELMTRIANCVLHRSSVHEFEEWFEDFRYDGAVFHDEDLESEVACAIEYLDSYTHDEVLAELRHIALDFQRVENHFLCRHGAVRVLVSAGKKAEPNEEPQTPRLVVFLPDEIAAEEPEARPPTLRFEPPFDFQALCPPCDNPVDLMNYLETRPWSYAVEVMAEENFAVAA